MSKNRKALTPPKRYTDLVGQRVQYKSAQSQETVYGSVQMPPFTNHVNRFDNKSAKGSKRQTAQWFVLVTDERGHTHPVPANSVRLRRHQRAS